MEVQKSLINKTLYIKLKGRIDSSSSQQFEDKVFDCFIDIEKAIIDVSNLDYISSAGLRVILKIKKIVKELEVVEASNEIYDILNMTGFTQIIKIKKKLREISVDGCEIIGKGHYGTVYRIAKDSIVKVYSKEISLERIENERELAKKTFVLGIPTAIPYDIVKVGNQYGAVFELLEAQNLKDKIIKDIDHVDCYLKMSIDILKKFHQAHVDSKGLIDIRDKFIKWARDIKPLLDSEVGDRIINLINGINQTNNLIHGDYHIKNILMVGDEPYIIDMDTVMMGSPIFEFGYMYTSYAGFQEIDSNNCMKFFGLDSKTAYSLFTKSIDIYFSDKTKEYRNDIIKKSRILCYIQMLKRSVAHPEDAKANEYFKECMSELVFQVNDLNI